MEPLAGPSSPPNVTPLPSRPASLSGRRLGFLNNGKINADVLLRYLEEILRQQYQIATVVWATKPGPSQPALPAVIDELVAQCDLAITAIGD